METIYIPTYKDLKSDVALYVDRFCGYVTSINFTLRLQTAEYRVGPKINYILKKIIEDNYIQSNGLMRLLGSCTMGILKHTEEHEIKKRELKTKQMEIKFEETLDRSYKNDLKAKIDQLEKLKKLHMNIMETLIEKQKMLWKISKNSSKKDSDKLKLNYLNTVGKEEKIRGEMKEIINCINTGLQCKISDRLEKSIETLRWLAANFISYERSDEILSKINRLDITDITKDIIYSFCQRYRFAVPSDYFYFLDFDSYLLKKPQNMNPEKLTLCVDLLEDKTVSECVYLQKFLANKKTGIRRFFSFKSKSSTKEVPKTRNEIYSEMLKEKFHKKLINEC